jgi:hypothetical protein
MSVLGARRGGQFRLSGGHGQNYRQVNFLVSLMRYYFRFPSVGRGALGPRKPPRRRQIIGAPRRPHLSAPGLIAAPGNAIAVAVVVAAAQEENLLAAAANDESERVDAGEGPQ